MKPASAARPIANQGGSGSRASNGSAISWPLQANPSCCGASPPTSVPLTVTKPTGSSVSLVTARVASATPGSAACSDSRSPTCRFGPHFAGDDDPRLQRRKAPGRQVGHADALRGARGGPCGQERWRRRLAAHPRPRTCAPPRTRRRAGDAAGQPGTRMPRAECEKPSSRT